MELCGGNSREPGRLKDMGYEQVELIPTDSGRFMSKWESQWMGLKGSAILLGKK